MNETWKQCLGQAVEGKFHLEQFLGETGNSANFLARSAGPSPATVVVKLVVADSGFAETQLSLWGRAARLTHRNLLRVLQSGRCRILSRDFLYVVEERAEEDLGQVLAERALTPDEAREMLAQVLDALVYLHSKGLVHGHLKPSNVLAIGDHVKLSSESFLAIGTARTAQRKLDVYDAPELASVPISAASDIWSLGVTLVETLTQQPPVVNPKQDAEPVLPETMPQPFRDIARHSLLFNPQRRWTVVDIAAHLKSGGAAATFANAMAAATTPAISKPPTASDAPVAPKMTPSIHKPSTIPTASVPPRPVAPASVPLSPVRATSAANLPKVPPMPSRANALSSRPQKLPPQPHPVVLPNYVIPALAGVFLLVAIYALPKILHREAGASPSTSVTSAPAATESKPLAPAVNREASLAKRTANDPPKSAAEKKPEVEATPELTSSAAPASIRSKTFAAKGETSGSRSLSARGDVLDQVLPEVSSKARETISGTIRVEVAAHVDAAGNVSDVQLANPGPSRYFAELALKAARQWEFSSPEINGRSMPSDWLIRFEFRNTGTQAIPKQTSP